MSRVTLFYRYAFRAGLLAVLVSACGGQSFTRGGDGGDAGDGGTISQGGTSSKGGSTSHGGTTSKAGTGFGGTRPIAGAAGEAATGGTGGYGNEACDAPPVSGNCDAAFPAWWHDPSTGVCTPFIYGGCGGNLNRYDSLEACQKACPGSALDSCMVPTDCMITSTSCCGICDGPGLTAHDVISVNRAYGGSVCTGFLQQDPPGGDAGAAAPACAPCPVPPPGQGTLKYLIPDCQAGRCVVNDIRTSSVTACKSDNECVLRAGTSCCESCSSGDEVSIRNDGSLAKLVCGNQPIACPACAPPPSGAVPMCGADGHCTKVYPL